MRFRQELCGWRSARALGFAYSYDSKTVIRGGVGIVYNSTQWFGAGISNQASGPAAVSASRSSSCRTAFPSSINPQWPVYDPAVGSRRTRSIAAPASSIRTPAAPPAIAQWSLGVQREITKNLARRSFLCRETAATGCLRRCSRASTTSAAIS